MYQLPNKIISLSIFFLGKIISLSVTRGMYNIDMKRLLAIVTLFNIILLVEMKADLLSPSIPPLPPHSLVVTSHIDTEKKLSFTFIEDKVVCINYCEESCSDLDNNKEHVICVTMCIINCGSPLDVKSIKGKLHKE